MDTLQILCKTLDSHPDFLLGYSDQPEVHTYADEVIKYLKKLSAEDQALALKQIKLLKKVRSNYKKPALVREIHSVKLLIN